MRFSARSSVRSVSLIGRGGGLYSNATLHSQLLASLAYPVRS